MSPGACRARGLRLELFPAPLTDTHFGWDATLDDGIRYIQAALSTPPERLSRWHTLSIGEFGREPLCIWSSVDGLAPKMHCRWSGFYEHHARMRSADGREFQLARYAARYPRTDKRAEAVDPDFSHESEHGAVAGSRMRTSDPAFDEAAAEEGAGRRWPRGVWRTGQTPL
jgi:hypothetical protein